MQERCRIYIYVQTRGVGDGALWHDRPVNFILIPERLPACPSYLLGFGGAGQSCHYGRGAHATKRLPNEGLCGQT